MTVVEQPVSMILRILVVENDHEVRNTHIETFQHWGYEVYAAEYNQDMKQALWDDAAMKARKYRCHLAIVDVRLRKDDDPDDRSGLELIPKLSPTISIVCTGWKEAIPAFNSLSSSLDPPLRPYTVVGKEAGYDELYRVIKNATTKYWPHVESQVRLIRSHEANASRQLERYWQDSEVEELLRQLFPNNRELRLDVLPSSKRSSGLSLRSHSLVLQATADNEVPVVVKLARAKRAATERENYHLYVSRYFPGRFYGRHVRSDAMWEWACAVYEFMGSIAPKMRLFTDYYEQETEARIRSALNGFGDNLGELYQRTRQDSPQSLFEMYRESWGSEWCERLADFDVSFPAPNILERWKLPSPAAWIRQHVDVQEPSRRDATCFLPNVHTAIIHGDLHGENMFVDGRGDIWLIDYERSGPGPILQDWSELENDILTRLAPFGPDDVSVFCSLAIRLLASDKIDKVTIQKADSGEMRKALKVIQMIRKKARASTGVEDIRLYLWSLLLNVVFRLMFWQERFATMEGSSSEESLARLQQCLLLGGLICHRIETIETKAGTWPPKEWDSILRGLPSKDSASKPQAHSAFSYDVFISYSSKDEAWVQDELLPRLAKTNLRVCIDNRDFKPGAPSVTEMERAIQTSRKTIAVLTPHYLDSAWTEFEGLMLMTLDPASRDRRFIPLLKEKCKLPTRIGYLVYINLADPQDVELSWKRLLEALADPANSA